jgi:hypothetical protein
MLFLAASTNKLGKTYASVKNATKAIAHLATVTGCAPAPDSPGHGQIWNTTLTGKMMRAIKKNCSAHKKTKRLPITATILRKLICKKSLPLDDDSSPFARALASAAVVCFFGLFRAGELVDKGPAHDNMLLRRDVSFHDDGLVEILLRKSKTDPARRGQTILLFENGSNLCPVAHLRRALDSARDTRPNAPVFQRNSGQPISYTDLMKFLRRRLTLAGFDPADFGTQSLRIGAATTLAIIGCSDAVIRAMGRWTSACFQLYVRCTPQHLKVISDMMASAAKSSSNKDAHFGKLPIAHALQIRHDNLSGFANRLHQY